MAPSATHRSLLLLCVVGSLICASSAQTCGSQNFTSKTFQKCSDLPVLNASLHWTYFPSNGTVDIAYWATPDSAGDWVAWAINPTGKGMAGSQAIIGYVKSGRVNVITANVSSYGYNPSMKNENLSFPVFNLSGESSGDKDVILFATLRLPTNNSIVNQVWQTGPMSGGIISPHPTTGAHRQSTGTLDLLSNQSTPTPAPTPTSGGDSKIRRKNVTFLANSFLFDSIVLLSMLASYII